MKQFSLDIWLQNKSRKVVTRRGNPVRIICTDRKHGEDKSPVVFLEEIKGGEMLLTCKSDGRSDNYDTPYDLFFADEEEELTEFEKKLKEVLYEHATTNTSSEEKTRQYSPELLNLARKELKKSFVLLAKEDYQIAFDLGKTDALKNLPKWKKDSNNLSSLIYTLDNRGDGRIFLCRKGYAININELLNLPKEE